jgi:protein-serine/threonine kinase
MAPSISQVSTFSNIGTPAGGSTVHPSPNPLVEQTSTTLNIRPLDMMTSGTEVYEELDRRIDEMRGWLECVEIGLDDLLKSPSAGAVDEVAAL